MTIKNLSIFFFVLVVFKLQAQEIYTQIFSYKYSFQPNNVDKIRKSENMILLTNNRSSYFVSTSNFLLDSIISSQAYLIKSQMDRIAILMKYPTHNNYFIQTIPNTKKIIYTEGATPQANAQYEETIPQKWELINEQKVINGIKCKKATQTLFGRTWIAWYSSSIPIPYGPYKFFGLPGLIIEIHDDKNHYKFTLQKIKENVRAIFPRVAFENPLLTTKTKATELIVKSKYTHAPSEGEKVYVNGVLDPNINQRIQKRLDEQRKKENNPIELQINP